jgi:hypothetical protein
METQTFTFASSTLCRPPLVFWAWSPATSSGMSFVCRAAATIGTLAAATDASEVLPKNERRLAPSLLSEFRPESARCYPPLLMG